MSTLPAWIKSQRRARGTCEDCGNGPQDTRYGSAEGPLICWACCTKRQDEYAARCQS
jgi:hypothetical protein